MRFGNWASCPTSAFCLSRLRRSRRPLAVTRQSPVRSRDFRGSSGVGWDLGSDLKVRLRSVLGARFDELFAAGAEGFVPRYVAPGREILITWQPQTEDL